jgi:hypothetical protein
VALCAAALGNDAGGQRRAIARGDGRGCPGMGYAEDRSKPCISWRLRDGSAGHHGGPGLLAGSLPVWTLSDALVPWMGLAMCPRRSPLSTGR